MPEYLAWRIQTGKLDYEKVIQRYGKYKEAIDAILKAAGCGWEETNADN